MNEFLRLIHTYLITGLILAAFYDINVYSRLNIKLKLRITMSLFMIVAWLPLHIWGFININRK